MTRKPLKGILLFCPKGHPVIFRLWGNMSFSPFSFFSQPQTCSAKGTEQPCEKNLSLWPGKLGNRVSVIHKGWGELSCFFRFSLFFLHFKQGQPQLRANCTMQKYKHICVFLIKVTGKRPLETEEYGGNHGDENNWKRQPHSGYEVIQITTCVCWK